MNIVLRKDKSEKLSISELDGNFEYLAVNSDDVDLFWRTSQVDNVVDSIYIRNANDSLWYIKTFTTRVYKLGVSIRNYNFIKDDNPQLVIERYKKGERKIRKYIDVDNKEQVVEANTDSRFRMPDPYNDNVTSTEMQDVDPSKVTIFRPMIIPIVGTSSYYTISAENYFSQKLPPKVSGCKNNFYKEYGVEATIFDDQEICSMSTRRRRIGSTYCRLRIRTSNGLGGYNYTKPLKDFKIKMTILAEGSPATINSVCSYEMI